MTKLLRALSRCFFAAAQSSISVAVLGLSALTACGGGGGGVDTPATVVPSGVSATAAAVPQAANATAEAVNAPVATPLASAASGASTDSGHGASAGGTAASGTAARAGAGQVIKLRASASLSSGIGALVGLRINGVAAASVEVRSLVPADYNFDVAAAARDGDTLELLFANASDAAGQPLRHLRVESLSAAGATLRPTDHDVVFDRGDGVAAFDGQDMHPGHAVMVASGALRFTLPPAPLTANATAAATVAPGVFVDAINGNDAEAGTHARPWRTLARLASVKLKAGEGIHLRCGGLWREALVLTAAQLVDSSTVAGYGADCASRKAVISGADDFSAGWTKSGSVWSRSLPAGTPKITQLFVDGQPMQTARWPDAAAGGRQHALAGAAAATGTQVALLATDRTALTGRDVAGATALLRTQPWLIESRRAAGAVGSALTLDRQPHWSLDAGEGYVLQDKLWMLDSAGEFFHDTATQRLHLMAPATGSDADINLALIEGSVRDVALSLSQRSRLVVRDLGFSAARETGLLLSDTAGAVVSRSSASDNALSGMRVEQTTTLPPGASGPTLGDNTLAGNGRYGIDAVYAERVTVSRNRVAATGTAPQHQASVLAAIGTGPGGRVEDNIVDGAGYVGISFSGQGASVVNGNTVMGYCARLSDCGAIYTWQGRANALVPQSAHIEGNRILAARAQLEGAVSGGREVVAGIYLDDFSHSMVVRGNLVVGAPIGIFLHNASKITVEANRIWLPTLVALWAETDQRDGDWLSGNVLRLNEIVPLVQAEAAAAAGGLPKFATSQAFWFGHAIDGDAAMAAGRNTFADNRVVQLQGAVAEHAMLRGPAGHRFVDAMQWQSLNAAELKPLRPARFDAATLVLGPELVADGGFDGGMASWSSYHDTSGQGFALQPLSALPGCVGACLRMTAGHPGDLLASASFALRPGRAHVYRWTAVLHASVAVVGIGWPYISSDTTPWDNLAEAAGYSGYGPRRGGAGETVSHEVFFIAKTAGPARVHWQLETLGTPVALDNVSVRELIGHTAATAADWTALAAAPAHAARSIGCAELGWPAGCSAIGLDGQPVSLPLLLAARTERLLLRADSPFRR